MVVIKLIAIGLSILVLVFSKQCELDYPPCMCTADIRPVCGSDGCTYNNICELECAKCYYPDLYLAHNGTCECICTAISEPVCGTDGKNYENPCELNCAATANNDPCLTIDCYGQCPCIEDSN
ncbi:serine protease inhibitor dipetalogastin-like [Contarinia nasturtii]|uniref:serine protease inhibitor dipetalogastin-like n=1 Tax=Contarinia nasturtii TaxID=265458 RepID=UPI0012D49AD8|nr:serine protease inhibitor dipetalogastin-like [Contarinia nasturtii]